MKILANDVKTVLSKNMLADGFDLIQDLASSHGSWIVDHRSGKEYLDMFSMFASGSVGYNHPRIREHKDELGEVALLKPTLSDLYNVYLAEFVATFDEVAIPDYLKHSFFVEGGALAVENALKTAFDWKVRKNMEAGLGSKLGLQVIHFKQAFHGRSGYTLSLTNTTDPRKTMYFPTFDWPRIDNPKLSFPIDDDVLKQVMEAETKAINQIKSAINDNPNDIAALLIEPIQGEGGDNHFRREFFAELRQICDENEIIFIMDEVQTGMGITGKMWAHEHYGVKPDILSFGKKTQVCGILAGPRIDEVEKNVFVESSRINSTFGGNLTDMWRFKIILDIIRDENLVENARIQGQYIQEQMKGLETEFPAYVTNSRGAGLFCAFDLPSDTERDELWGRMMDNGLLILTCGDKSIRVRPHLNVKREDIDTTFEIIRKSMKACLK
ncbi:MAG: L-lysine 6-transaminase [Candidatus Marinimicrobia bacterium]|nr:L-lysine 6-transaminase [Candidatus Neomarinimicrobiota bacterium]